MINALVGTEHFLIERACARLKERLLQGLSDFDFDQFAAGVTPVTRVLESLNTLPFLGGKRVLIIKEVEKFKKEDLETLEPALKNLPESIELLLVGGKIDRRFRFWQTVEKQGKLVEYKTLYPREVPGWMNEELRSHGVKIQPKALSWLAGVVGVDVGSIAATLEKLRLLIGDRNEITLQDVERCVTAFSWKSLFDLTDAVGTRNKSLSLKLFRSMAASGESPVGLLALIARHFRILFKIKSSPRQGATDFGISPYFFKDYVRQAERFSLPDLKKVYENIFHTDWNLKSSPLPGEVIFERLLWELCS